MTNQKLFNTLKELFGVSALQSEMQEIINAVNEQFTPSIANGEQIPVCKCTALEISSCGNFCNNCGLLVAEQSQPTDVDRMDSNIQNALINIHHKYGTSEKAIYEIQKLFDKAMQEAVRQVYQTLSNKQKMSLLAIEADPMLVADVKLRVKIRELQHELNQLKSQPRGVDLPSAYCVLERINEDDFTQSSVWFKTLDEAVKHKEFWKRKTDVYVVGRFY